jgi:hypothetical protein
MKKLLRECGNVLLFYQFFRKMKLTILIVTASILSCLSAETYSQTAKLTITETNSTLMNILRAIEEQSEFKFFFNEKVDVNKPVSVEVREKSVTEILDKVLSGTSVKYKILGRQIALYDKEEMEPFMNEQQGKKITGKVTDSSGAALPGASVVVKGTTTGVITDANGDYSLSNVPENATLLFSFVGMNSQEVQVKNKTRLNVTLISSVESLNEVVVVGYDTQKKVNLTGSVQNVRSEDLTKRNASNTSVALQGLVPGVSVVTSSGRPGYDGAGIKIRGTGSLNSSSAPLVLIDGVEGYMNFLDKSSLL